MNATKKVNIQKSKSKCKKWLLMNKKLSDEYDVSIILCGNCRNYAFPYFIHDKLGDYTCCICNEDGEIINYCVYCKKYSQ